MKSPMLTLIIFLLLTIISCEQSFEKPKNVPEKATWLGGTDGGVWIEFLEAKDSSVALKIYSHNGEVLKNTEYISSEGCRDIKLNKVTLIEDISAFDGSNIILNIIENDRFCTLREIDN